MKIFIFANGNFSDHRNAFTIQQPGDLLIAADGGARHCREMGLYPQVAIGDFDSLSPTELDEMQAAGTQLIRYPPRKDFTDLELAIEYSLQLNPDEILIYGGLGQRWDQTLANLLLLAGSHRDNTSLRMIDEQQEIMPVSGPGSLVIRGNPGDTVSLIPIAGHAEGVSTEGLEYPLLDETLYFGATRGVSNVVLENTASINLRNGMLICVLIHNS